MKDFFETDICVVGAGAGGISAALSAKKQGADVLLVDKNGYLGGMTASGLPYLGYIDRKKRPNLGGFAVQFVDELAKRGAAVGVRYCPHHQSVVVVKPEEVKLACAELCREAGIGVLLHSYAVDVKTEDGRISSVTFDTAGNRFTVKAKVFVDATGDGVIGKLAGAAYEMGTAGVDLQPASVIYTIGGVDKDQFLAWIEEHPEELGAYSLDYLRARPDYTFVTLGGLFARLNPIGKWPMGIWAMICMNRLNKGEVALNGPRMAATDATDPESVTNAELLGQKQAQDFLDITLRGYVPGFENAFISHINDGIGVRETRRLRGKKYLTVLSAQNAEVPDDTIALSSYPIDIHSSKDNTSYMIKLEEPFGIPYLCTVSENIDNLMMSGRLISVDRNVFGSTRVMGTCFAIGEAVGYGAALAVKEGIDPGNVDPARVRELLLANGGILTMDGISPVIPE